MTINQLIIEYLIQSLPYGIALGVTVKITRFAFNLFLGKHEVSL